MSVSFLSNRWQGLLAHRRFFCFVESLLAAGPVAELGEGEDGY
jgi:hypothetical protein